MPPPKTRVGPHERLFIEATFSPPRNPVRAVTGAPYSAEQVIGRELILESGTDLGVPDIWDNPSGFGIPRIFSGRTYVSHERQGIRIYRDSAGRTRTESPFFSGSNPPPDAPMNIEIDDVVEGYRYILDTENRVAHRSVLAAVPGPDLPPLWRCADRSAFKSLGTRTIEGVRAEGRKTAHVLSEGRRPGGYATGQPYGPSVSYIGVQAASSEEWYSTDLKAAVLTKSFTPRRGDETMPLKNVSRAEPDPSLFQVPPGYKVVDETGPFTIKITRSSR